MPTFKCDTCGAKIQINDALKTPACEYCGSNIVLTKEMRTHIAKVQADKQQQEATHKPVGTQSPKWNDQNNRGAKLMNMVMKLIMWPLFGFFLLSAMAFIPSVTSLLMALLALFFLPISSVQSIKQNLLKKKWMRVVVPIVLFLAAVGTLPSTSIDTDTDDSATTVVIETSAPTIVEATLNSTTDAPQPTENTVIIATQETEKPTTKPTAKPTTKPTTKPTATPTVKATEKMAVTPTPKLTATPAPTEETYTYVYNKNTKKFHYSWCNSVDDMKEKNRGERTTTRDKMISMGYDPCGRCHP